MHFRKALLTFSSITFILVLGWIFLLFNQAILEENSNHNLKHVPENATFALRIDGRELAEKTLFSVFLESKDEEVLALLQSSFSKATKAETKFKNYGIDYLSDLILFEIPYKGKTVQGLLVNVSNERLFRKNLVNSPNSFACMHNVGVILSADKSDKILKQDLQVLATKIVSLEQNTTMSGTIAHRGSGKFIETYTKGFLLGKSSFFGISNVLFELQKNDLLISGQLDVNKKTNVQPYKKMLQPKGLHLSTSLIQQNINDSLNNWIAQFDLTIPKISEVSINFMGTKVINHSSGFFVVPQMELLVECEKSFDIKQFLSSEKLMTYLDYSLEDKYVAFQDERLYFKQVSPTSFYIGINAEPVVKRNAVKALLSVQGELQPLTHIQGGGMMTAFLEMMPIYRASKNLSDHTERIEIEILKVKSGTSTLNGQLTFSKGYYPMNEILKFLLVGQLVN